MAGPSPLRGGKSLQWSFLLLAIAVAAGDEASHQAAEVPTGGPEALPGAALPPRDRWRTVANASWHSAADAVLSGASRARASARAALRRPLNLAESQDEGSEDLSMILLAVLIISAVGIRQLFNIIRGEIPDIGLAPSTPVHNTHHSMRPTLSQALLPTSPDPETRLPFRKRAGSLASLGSSLPVVSGQYRARVETAAAALQTPSSPLAKDKARHASMPALAALKGGGGSTSQLQLPDPTPVPETGRRGSLTSLFSRGSASKDASGAKKGPAVAMPTSSPSIQKLDATSRLVARRQSLEQAFRS